MRNEPESISDLFKKLKTNLKNLRKFESHW